MEQKNKGTAQKVAFRPSSKADIPETASKRYSEFIQQAKRELSIMNVGEVLKIPISDYVEEAHRKATRKRYAYSCREASKRVEGTFKVYERGMDVFIERQA